MVAVIFSFLRIARVRFSVDAVIVTGASGFIGRALVVRLKSLGYKVVEFNHSDGDIVDKTLFSALPKASHVIHLAGRHFVPDSWSEPLEFLRVNLLGTQNIIDHCLKHGSKLIFSSAYLYGVPDYNPIAEDHPVTSNNPYALSKYFGEQLIKFFCDYKGLNATTLRLFNVYGDGQNIDYLIPSVLSQVAAGHDIKVNNLLPSRDYVYVEDVVTSIILAMESSHKYKVFNIGSGTSYSVEELIDIIKKVTESDAKVISREQYRENEVMDVVADTRRAQEILHWTPKYTLEQGLRDLWSKTNL